MTKEEIIKKLDLEIQAIDSVNKDMLKEIELLELSIKKKELILQKIKLEELYNS